MSNIPITQQQGITDIVTQGVTNSTGSMLPIYTATYRFQQSEKIFTDGYQDDPISFVTDARFLPTQIASVLSNIPNTAPRDLSSYVEINITSDTTQYLSIGLYSTKYNPTSYDKVLANKKQFIQFGV